MTNPRDDLRATEQAIHHDAKAIVRLEEQKAALDPTDASCTRQVLSVSWELGA